MKKKLAGALVLALMCFWAAGNPGLPGQAKAPQDEKSSDDDEAWSGA